LIPIAVIPRAYRQASLISKGATIVGLWNEYGSEEHVRMDLQIVAILVSMAVSIVTLVLLVLQTRALSVQTRSVAKSLEYGAYLKLVDYLNDINLQLMTNQATQDVFRRMDFIADTLRDNEDLSIESIALGWHMLNRYEAAFVGYRQGIVPVTEWAVWRQRLQLDMRLPFMRKIWFQEVKNFAYDPGFIALVSELIAQSDLDSEARASPESTGADLPGGDHHAT
jgi:hypothetical protein